MVKICQTGLDPKNAFSGFCQKFPQAMDEVETFFWQFPNPWALRVSGMGGYTSKCEKKSKSLHPSGHLPLNLCIFYSASVTFTLTTVQVPYLAMIHTELITVQQS